MNNRPTLMHITHELTTLGNQVILQDGEITEEQSVELTELLQQSEDKVTSYVNFMEYLEQEKMLVTMAIKHAQGYLSRLEKTQESLKSSALKAIAMKGKKLVGSMGHWISTRKSTSIHITNPDVVSNEYIKSVVTNSFDKIAIRQAMEAGQVVDGAEMVENVGVTWR